MITATEAAAIAAQPPADPLTGDDMAMALGLSVLIITLLVTKLVGFWE